MRKVWVVMAVLCGLTGMVNAAEIAGSEVAVTVDATYTTKYIWRGFDLYDDHPAFQPSVNFAWENGFSFNIWGSMVGGSSDSFGNSIVAGGVDGEEWDYTLAYSGTVNEGCPWKANYTVGWRFYDFPDVASNDADVQELFISAAFPDLVGGGVVPHAAFMQMWPSEGKGNNHDFSGGIYLVGFTYGFTMDQAPELPMTFGWDIVYNDGTGADAIDSDWSHMVWSLSTTTTCPLTGAKVTPSIYYQNSFEDTVNTEDELWASLSYSFSF